MTDDETCYCPACGHEVSSRADACPACGDPLGDDSAENSATVPLAVGGVTALVGLFGFALVAGAIAAATGWVAYKRGSGGGALVAGVGVLEILVGGLFLLHWQLQVLAVVGV